MTEHGDDLDDILDNSSDDISVVESSVGMDMKGMFRILTKGQEQMLLRIADIEQRQVLLTTPISTRVQVLVFDLSSHHLSSHHALSRMMMRRLIWFKFTSTRYRCSNEVDVATHTICLPGKRIGCSTCLIPLKKEIIKEQYSANHYRF